MSNHADLTVLAALCCQQSCNKLIMASASTKGLAKWTKRQDTKKDGKQSHLGHITGESHHQILDSRTPGFWLPLMTDPRQILPR